MHTTRREILLVCAAALLALTAIGVRTAEAATAGPSSVLAFGANASCVARTAGPSLVDAPGASLVRITASLGFRDLGGILEYVPYRSGIEKRASPSRT